MAKYIPPGFDPARVIEGLHKAMGFGEPTRTADKATFYFPKRSHIDSSTDDEGVPFDPTVRPKDISRPKQIVPCAVEFYMRGDTVETFGTLQSTRIKITLLDGDYQKVKGFAYVVAGGDKYIYDLTQPPDALGSLDVWTVWAIAEDDA